MKLSTTVLSARLLIGSRFTPSQILALKPKTETLYKLDLEGHMEPTQKDFTPGPSDLSNFLHCKYKIKMNTCSMVGIRTMSLLEPSQKTLVKLLNQFLLCGIGNNSVKLYENTRIYLILITPT